MKTVIKDCKGKKHQDYFWVTANERTLHERGCDTCRGRRYIIVDNVAEKCSCTEPPYKLYPQTVLIEECHMTMRMNADLHLLAKHSNARFLIKGEFEGAGLVFDNDKNPDCSVYLTLEEARQNFAEDKKKIEGGLADRGIISLVEPSDAGTPKKTSKQKYGPEFPKDYSDVSASEIQKDIAGMVEDRNTHREGPSIFRDSPPDDDSWKTKEKSNRFI